MESERHALLDDLNGIPRDTFVRRINELVKRVRTYAAQSTSPPRTHARAAPGNGGMATVVNAGDVTVTVVPCPVIAL